MFRLLPQCWLLSFTCLSFFFATSFCFFNRQILASSRYLKFLLQYNSVLKRLDQPPLLIIFFFKNLAKKRRHSLATNRAMCLSTYWLEYGRHVARLRRRRRRRRAYAPTSNTASHDTHEKINSWVSFSYPWWCLWGSAERPFGPRAPLLYVNRMPEYRSALLAFFSKRPPRQRRVAVFPLRGM